MFLLFFRFLIFKLVWVSKIRFSVRFRFCFSHFHLEVRVAATTSLSLDWLPIPIRVSKKRFSIFSIFSIFFVVFCVEIRLIATISHSFDGRFWFRFRNSVFRFFQFLMFKLVWVRQSRLVLTDCRFWFKSRKSVFRFVFVFFRFLSWS